MAALTWRDVAAPDFGTSLQGINQFSRLLGDAFGGAERAVGRFDSAQDEMANRAINERALAIRDPAAYEAALADGSLLGTDRARASTATLAGLDNRVGTLVNQALGKVNLESTTRANEQDKAFDALVSDDIKAEKARFAGKPDLELEASIEARAGSVGAKNALAMMRGWRSAETEGLSNDNTRQQMSQSATNFANAQTDRRELREAQGLMAQFFQNGGTMEDLPDMLINAGVKGPVAAQLITMAGGVLPASFGSLGDIGSGGGGAGADFSMGAPQQAVATSLKGAGLSDAVTAGFLGNFHIEGGYGGAQGDGGTAGGIAQWRGSRRDMFIKRMGVDPTRATPAQQAQYAAWELTTPEGRRSAGISEADARAIMSAKDPATAARLIDKHFERSDGKSTGARAAAAQQAHASLTGAVTARQGSAARRLGVNGDTGAAAFAAAKTNDADITSVVNSLSKDFPNASKGDITKQIQFIKARARQQGQTINDAVAGEIYRRSGAGHSRVAGWFNSWFNNDEMGDGQYSSVENIDSSLRMLRRGDDQAAMVTNANIAATAASADQARAVQSQAAARLAAARRRVRDPRILARYEREYAQAAADAAMYQQLEGQSNNGFYGNAAEEDAAAAAAEEARRRGAFRGQANRFQFSGPGVPTR